MSNVIGPLPLHNMYKDHKKYSMLTTNYIMLLYVASQASKPGKEKMYQLLL